MGINTMVIGRGEIGGELLRRLNQSTMYAVSGIVTSKHFCVTTNDGKNFNCNVNHTRLGGFKGFVEYLKPKLAFLCIPTRDHGETAWGYAHILLDHGVLVVTAEKGIMAWQFKNARLHLNNIDVGAAVGGGNRFLYTMNDRCLRGKRIAIWAVFNATLNKILWEIQDGASLENACKTASKIGIAEPLQSGQELNPFTLIDGELQDVRMKICAFYNFVLAEGEYLTPDRFGPPSKVSAEDLTRLVSVYDRRRFVVLITNDEKEVDRDNNLITPMETKIGAYVIRAGFKSIRADTFMGRWIPGDIDNGILLREDGNTYMYSGPGAGSATVDAMMAGAARLIKGQLQANTKE